jgi:hypothetical protein
MLVLTLRSWEEEGSMATTTTRREDETGGDGITREGEGERSGFDG